jgi:DNA-binding PadR family transcriptional regulator
VEPTDKPIGYWLKHLDRLIESAFKRALAEHGLSRRHWQALNTLEAAPLGIEELRTALDPFWGEGTGDGVTTVEDITAELRDRGWITRLGDRGYTLTEQGRAAHAAAAERVRETRRLVLNGLTDQDYAATVRTLRRMAANLERPLGH